MIAVEGLHKGYGHRVALEEVSFEVPKGEIFGFVGPNGAGKTTTIRILATLSSADAGEATVGGIPVHESPAEVRGLIGYMPDFFGVYDRLTSAGDSWTGVPDRKSTRLNSSHRGISYAVLFLTTNRSPFKRAIC